MNKFFKRWLGGRSIAALSSGRNVGIAQTSSKMAATLLESSDDALIHSAVRIIASSIAQCEWSSPDAKTNAILLRPNDWQTQYEWMFSTVHSLLVYGRSPQEIIRNGDGDVRRLDPLAPETVNVEENALGLPIYQIEAKSGELERTLKTSQVLYFIDIATAHLETVSRVGAARKRITMLKTTDQTADNVMRKGITASWVVSVERSLGAEERKVYGEELRKGLGLDGDDSGGIVVLDKGLELRREKIGSPIDGDMRQLREDLKREVASSLGVPPFLVGGDSDTKYNNVSARMTALHRETLYPLIVNIRQRLESTFGSPVHCDEAAIESGDWQMQIDTLTAATGKPILTQNEARQKIRYPAVEGGDEMASTAGVVEGADRRGEMPSDTGHGDGPEEE